MSTKGGMLRIRSVLVTVLTSMLILFGTLTSSRADDAVVDGPLVSNQAAIFDFFTASSTSYKLTLDWLDIFRPTTYTYGSFGVAIMDDMTGVTVGSIFESASAAASGNLDKIVNGLTVGGDYMLVIYATGLSITPYSIGNVHGTATAIAVPGPEAGAGLAGLMMLGAGVYVMRRRRAGTAVAA